eukprot:gnl/Spiro4/7194_TR3748_c0_g1_i1.p1 gnl/Spiro4/7194_TR3748_c0_g1~~gnl/Spiro4/7194_TR3748_c0_g1_i1.p1  ORF type:complete len:405 (-),score=67.01 gnl/Spiro4/7194_TR3748_c0_g1_i1:151-1365(-)
MRLEHCLARSVRVVGARNLLPVDDSDPLLDVLEIADPINSNVTVVLNLHHDHTAPSRFADQLRKVLAQTANISEVWTCVFASGDFDDIITTASPSITTTTPPPDTTATTTAPSPSPAVADSTASSSSSLPSLPSSSSFPSSSSSLPLSSAAVSASAYRAVVDSFREQALQRGTALRFIESDFEPFRAYGRFQLALQTTSPYVVFYDDDVFPESENVMMYLRAFADFRASTQRAILGSSGVTRPGFDPAEPSGLPEQFLSGSEKSNELLLMTESVEAAYGRRLLADSPLEEVEVLGRGTWVLQTDVLRFLFLDRISDWQPVDPVTGSEQKALLDIGRAPRYAGVRSFVVHPRSDMEAAVRIEDDSVLLSYRQGLYPDPDPPLDVVETQPTALPHFELDDGDPHPH